MKTATSNPLAKPLIALSALAVIASPALAWQETLPDWVDTEAEQRGYEIAMRSDNSDNGFGDSRVTATMTLRKDIPQASRFFFESI